jgi:ribose 1,5-bisphosphokinase
MMASALIEQELERGRLPLRTGCFVAVVGPSGAGKDTLIGFAKDRLAAESDVHFVRRIITRPSNSEAESHDTLTLPEFEAAEKDGAFALSWRAHGLAYGLPATIDTHMENGMAVVANLSRSALPVARERYGNLIVVLVTADPQILAERLGRRARESSDEVLARMSRVSGDRQHLVDAIEIANNGTAEEAGLALVEVIRKALARAAVSWTV